MRGIVIGAGEVGSALWKVLSEAYKDTTLLDLEFVKFHINDGWHAISQSNIGGQEIMHICFPWSDKFIDSVCRYQKEIRPKYTVIHSTVPVGTSRKVVAVHSPVRGMHPHMEEGLRRFVKFVGGPAPEADAVADYLRRAGMRIKLCRKQETTELAKLVSTLYYGVCIEFVKEAERLCEKHGVPFSETFTLWQKTYNEGYRDILMPEYARPVLEPIQQEIGGHCVVPNAALLDSKFSEIVRNEIENQIPDEMPAMRSKLDFSSRIRNFSTTKAKLHRFCTGCGFSDEESISSMSEGDVLKADLCPRCARPLVKRVEIDTKDVAMEIPAE